MNGEDPKGGHEPNIELLQTKLLVWPCKKIINWNAMNSFYQEYDLVGTIIIVSKTYDARVEPKIIFLA